MSGENRGRPEAAAVVWRWRSSDDERSARAARARRGGVIRALVAAAAACVFFWLDRPIMTGVVAAIGALTLILALASPLGGYAAVERAVGKVGELVGAALTWLLLTPVYYFFFAPFGLLFRRGAKDPLRRAIDPSAPTYWQKRERDRPLDRPY